MSRVLGLAGGRESMCVEVTVTGAARSYPASPAYCIFWVIAYE
ncbi:MAG TPA: hypothetical protein VF865_02400 [Acidobacteriaceae bacterium]